MVGSTRLVGPPADENDVSVKTSGATTLAELISTIPYAYQVRLGDYLTRKYRVAHKHANVQSTLTIYERHLVDDSYPPIIRNTIKEPKLQFAKEFLATVEGAKAPKTFEGEVNVARKSLLKAAVTSKKSELKLLSSLILPEPGNWSEACKTVAKNIAESNGGRLTYSENNDVTFVGLPKSAEEEFDMMNDACGVYSYRVLSIARSAIDRAEIQKLSKITLKKNTDVEMTDVDAREPATRDIIREEIQALKKELSQASSQSTPVKRRGDALLTSHRETKKSKWQSTEGQRSSWEECEAKWWEEQEEEEGQEISVDAYLSQCSREWRPWAPDTFPNVYSSLSQKCRNKLNAAFSREWELDTAWSYKPGVFKYENVIIPEDIEYMLAVNHKYILHSMPEDHDVEEAKNKFVRAVRIRYQFRNEPSNTEYIPKFHVANPTWEPQKASPAIELGLDKAKEAIDQQIGLALTSVATKGPGQRNLNWTRVQQFLTNNNLLSKLTDKNLGLAVFPKRWYTHTIQEMLSDEKVYAQVSDVDIEQLRDTVFKKLSRWKLPKSMDNYVRQKTEYQIPEFHAIPKVHKTPWTLRPIVPSHSWATSRVSEVIDYLCRPMLTRMPWVVNSTKQVINNLSTVSKDSEDVWICTGDVVAFYTNIDALECARIVAGAWRIYASDSKIDDKVILNMIMFVMNNNYFQFQNRTYRQLDGLAMGTACAPLLANIYAAFYERKHGYITRQGVLLYNRYIDDNLLVFKGSEKDLTVFLDSYKLGSLTVKWDYSKAKKEFLDIEVLRIRDHSGWHLVTRLFKKAMNRHLYIPWSSAHPLHVKKAFVKAELIRFAMISSEAGYFADARTQFYGNLRRRGYPRETLENWFSQVLYEQRPVLLASEKQEREVPLMLSGQYNPVWEYINPSEVIRMARREWILEKDLPDSLNQPLIRSLSRSTSLFDLLSAWNKTILHPDTQSSEKVALRERLPLRNARIN